MSKATLHRILSLVLLSAFHAVFASSQVRVGVHGGAVFSGITDPPRDASGGAWEMQTFGFGGVLADLQITEHWLLASEINFVRKGIRIPSSGWGLPLPGTTTLTSNYYEVPLKIRYRAGGGPFKWYVEGGPSLGILESGRAHVVAQAVGVMPSSDEVIEVRGMYREFETALSLGLGGEYELTSTVTLAVAGRYSHGLSDAHDKFWSKVKSRGAACDLGVLVSL